jgi:hypothetical protein
MVPHLYKEGISPMKLYEVQVYRADRIPNAASNSVRPPEILERTLVVQANSPQQAKQVAVDVYRELYYTFKGLRIKLRTNLLQPPEAPFPGWLAPVLYESGDRFHTFQG